MTAASVKAAAPPRAKPPGAARATARPPERRAPPVRTPQRAALATAIARRDAAAMAHEAGRRALARAGEGLAQAEAAVEGARVRVKEAGEQRASELAAAAASGKPATSNAMRNARTELGDAEHEVEAATAAHAKLKANLADLEDAALDAENRVTAHADIVLRAGAEHLLAEAETAALRLRELMPLLGFMLRPEFKPEMVGLPQHPLFHTNWDVEAAPHVCGKERATRRSFAASDVLRLRNAPFEEVGGAIERFLDRPPHRDDVWYRHPVLEAWRAAREALHHDADAPLPPLPA
jgi:hypothetical protein